MPSRTRPVALSLVLGLLIAAFAWTGAGPAAARSNPLYTVSGVSVDVTEADASRAKLKAISEAQVKAFQVLLERLGGPEAAARLEHLSAAEIGRMMESLSIEEERTGPGRYIGRLTIRFLPDAVRQVLDRAGVDVTETRAPPVVVVPIWLGPDGPEAWSDNPWRAAWLELDPSHSLVPLVVPLGDLTDSRTLDPEQALNGDVGALETLRQRYSADGIVVAVAAATDGSTVRARLMGETPLGQFDVDESSTAADGGIAAAAEQLVGRLHAAMVDEWRKSAEVSRPAVGPVHAMSVAVPFRSLEEWTAIRNRLVSTPGVAGVDLANLSGSGAIVRLSYSVPVSELQAALAGRQLDLALRGETWVLRPF